jgi:hypothetical protein
MADTLVKSSYGDPLTRVKGLTPWQRYPERAEWDEWEIWAREDGSTYERTRHVFRWADSFSYGEWKIVETPLPGV